MLEEKSWNCFFHCEVDAWQVQRWLRRIEECLYEVLKGLYDLHLPLCDQRKHCRLCCHTESDISPVYCRSTKRGENKKEDCGKILKLLMHSNPNCVISYRQVIRFPFLFFFFVLVFLVECCFVSHIDSYILLDSSVNKLRKTKENQNFVILGCEKKDWCCHLKCTQMIRPYWSLCLAAWGEQEAAWAVPPENAVSDSANRSRSCDFSN